MKKKPYLKYVHIHAKCTWFEIFEQIPEDKAESRLKEIKSEFMKLSERHDMIEEFLTLSGSLKKYNNAQKLLVKTKLINPTLFTV